MHLQNELDSIKIDLVTEENWEDVAQAVNKLQVQRICYSVSW